MKIHSLFNTPSRYIRSINLERDFYDPEVISSYIPTDQTCAYLARILGGAARSSGMRAWRITGDYGSGKSSFALVLAKALSGEEIRLAKDNANWHALTKSKPLPKLFPILITGSREKPVLSILKRLAQALDASCPTRKPDVLRELLGDLETGKGIPNSVALSYIDRVSQYVRKSKKADGLLLIIDEMGKYLEYAALNPCEEDLFFFQELGELATRSGETPIFVISLLHQGFSAYAESLSIPLQREWNKVSGRFEEIVFQNNIEQALELLATALGVNQCKLPQSLKTISRTQIADAYQLGWLGRISENTTEQLGQQIYPLHPLSINPLLGLFNKYGQNERSLYSFLFSNEMYGLQHFADQALGENKYLRIHHVYDYAQSSFSHVINQNGYKSRWRFISAVVESLASNSEIESKILKTIGLLNLLDRNDLIATEEIVIQSIVDEKIKQEDVRISIENLLKRHAIYHRGVTNGFCLWPHTSLNLDTAYQQAVDCYILPNAIASALIKYLSTRPLVARRHFIETGTLRHFAVRYISFNEIKSYCPDFRNSDGEIVIPLCEHMEQYEEIVEMLARNTSLHEPGVLVALPKPLHGFRNLLIEVGRWEWVANNTPELNNDSFAAEEVSRQVALSRRLLQSRIEDTLTLRDLTSGSGILWFHNGTTKTIETGRVLLAYLSDICDELYSQAPIIRNELINRRSITTAAALARNKLISSILFNEYERFLGLPEDKKPPEMCIYLSMLFASGLHGQNLESGFSLPDDDKHRMRPIFNMMLSILKSDQGKRHTVQSIWDILSCPPFGVREGVLPILLATFLKMHDHALAIYENGTFQPKIDELNFQRIIKKPTSFEIQYLAIEGVKATVFSRIATILNLKIVKGRKTALLDVVTPLCSFAAKLTPYTGKTKTLSTKALNVRAALLSATDPARLIFHDLPIACEVASFLDSDEPNEKSLIAYTETLKNAINDLRVSYPSLLEYIRQTLEKAFAANLSKSQFRQHIQQRAGSLLLVVAEPGMKGFCQILADKSLQDQEWLESLGSYVCAKPPSKWVDRDKDIYYQKISFYCDQFIRIEAANFDPSQKQDSISAMRLLITRHDGTEESYVMHLTPEEEKQADKLSEQLHHFLGTDDKIALAATSRFAWKLIGSSKNQPGGKI